jgi:integral membrane sensor domain MASE1
MFERDQPTLREKIVASVLAGAAASVAAFLAGITVIVLLILFGSTTLSWHLFGGEGAAWLGISIGLPLGAAIAIGVFYGVFREIYRSHLEVVSQQTETLPISKRD